MREKAFFKMVYYKISLHPDSKKMLHLEKVFPYVRYNTSGQQHSVETNRRGEDWLIHEMERRLLFNPAFDQWDLVMLFDNRSKGFPQKIISYYERFLTKEVRRFPPSDYPQVSRKIFEILTANLD